MPRDLNADRGLLLKINYDLSFDASPTWADVGFEFVGQGVGVNDALPLSVTRYQDIRSYELTSSLGSAPKDGRWSGLWPHDVVASHITLPAIAPRVECFGIGGEDVWWRYASTATDAIAPGTRSTWLALLVPDGCRQLQVVAHAGYDLGARNPDGLRPYTRKDAFLVELPADPDAEPVPAQTLFSRPGAKPRVFVSYAHESPAHKQSVAELCALLHDHGVDVRVDVEGLHLRRNWNIWTNQQITDADFIIIVASPAYRAADLGALQPDVNRGVQSELDRIVDRMHANRVEWIPKILPVVLPGRSIDEIPLTFLPRIADYYLVEYFRPKGAASLLAVLDAARHKPPTL